MKQLDRYDELHHPLDQRVMPSQQMMMEIAAGLEEPEHIAARYGFSVKAFHQLASQPYFQQQVTHYEAELRATGVTFARKAAMLAEDLLEDAYKMAKSSHDHGVVLETAKWLAKMGRLEPVTTAARSEGGSGNAGGAAVFQLSINLGGKKEDFVIEGAVKEILAINNDLGVADESPVAGGGIGG